MLDGKVVQIELLNNRFIKKTFEDGSSLAFSRYDIMDNGRDVWHPEKLDKKEWKKIDNCTYKRIFHS